MKIKTIISSLFIAILFAGSALAQANLRVEDISDIATELEMEISQSDGTTIRVPAPGGLFLNGQGLVVGLPGTGDGEDPAARRLIGNFLRNRGYDINPATLDWKSVAIVTVTATYPAFARLGDPITVTVNVMGEARLQGGTLLETPLQGPGSVDDYLAVVQGPISFSPTDQINSTGTARGVIIKDVRTKFFREEKDEDHVLVREYFRLRLHRPNAQTAANVATAINQNYPMRGRTRPDNIAKVVSPALIEVDIDRAYWGHLPGAMRGGETEYLSFILGTPVDEAVRALVSINSGAGTIAATGPVRVTEGSVAIGPTISVQIPAGGMAFSDFLAQLRALALPANEIISVVRQLHQAGMIVGEVEFAN
ncbi:MAG: flagellar basal body P-ring protein FlgI [Planctomycetes bacterium]|nr:flagellar basal body P-ring protein FlgI [Planctomycetota bacterium]